MNPAILAINEQIEVYRKQLEEANSMIHNNDIDPDLKELATIEIPEIEAKIEQLTNAVNEIENPGSVTQTSGGESVKGDCIVEIRAGTGGDEAGLFASSLFLMYTRYAEAMKWKIELISKNEGGIGNIKEIVFEIKGKSSPTPYENLEYEIGVHRVQRIPVTESGGRIHTSTATVAVLPIVTEKEVNIRTEDLRVDTFRAGGKGGQHVNKTESAIRITHIPTGVVAQCQDERSQLKNREKAMSMLRAKLYEMMQRQQKNSLDELRAEQVGTGERSEKIRTYNFPQDRITDHRIKKSWFGIERILSGDLKQIFTDVRKGIESGEIGNAEEE